MPLSAPGFPAVPRAAARTLWHGAVGAITWVGAGALHAAVVVPAGDAAETAPWPSLLWPAAAALLLLALGGWAWQARQTRASRHALQQLRVERLALADTLDLWQWRSDAEHRITDWRPPSDAPATQWQSACGQRVWDCFEADDKAALRSRLEQHAALPALAVRCALGGALGGALDGAPAERQTVQLRAAVLTDAQGRFAGHLGTLRALPAAAGAPDHTTTLSAHAAHAASTAESDHESFIYTVSHDLRAPIRVVDGFTRILKEDYGRVLDRVGNDHLDRVLGAAARMNSMIDALLALSQLSTQPLARQAVNLSQLAGFILDDLQRQSPERVATVHVDDDLQTQGDPTLLRLVLENLLGNAWKYTGKCATAELWFGRDPADPGVYMVRDNGAGFDMRFADRLFGVFQRLHSASDFQGTGVGLASVRRIVRRHGGEVWAESEVGRGAVFRFTLASSGGPATRASAALR